MTDISIRKVLIPLVPAYLAALIFSSLIPLIDPSEARYALIEKDIVQSNDWVTPQIIFNGQRQPFLGKPPLAFWLGAASMRLFGINEFSARLPSFLAAIASLALIWLIVRRFQDDQVAATAVLLTGTTPFFVGLSGVVLVDMVETFFVVGALLAYFAFASETEPLYRRRWSMLVFACLAGGFMTKGPVSLVTFGLPVFVWTAWHRKWSLLKEHAWIRGGVIFLLLTVPWFWLCELKNHGFLHYFFVNENLLRFVTPDYGDRYGSGHVRAHGIALPMMLTAALPWTIFLLYWLWRRRISSWRFILREQPATLLLIGVVVNTLFWCFSRQLLITYMLPMVPMLCIWIAVATKSEMPWWSNSIPLASACMIPILCLGIAFAIIVSPSRSTKAAFLCIREEIETSDEDASAVVICKTPYSSYFYAPDLVELHPNEPVLDSLSRANAMPDQVYCVIKEKYLKQIPPERLAPYEQLAVKGCWHIYRRLGSAAQL